MTPRYTPAEPRTFQTACGPVRVVTTPEEWVLFRLWLRTQHTVAVDTETTGLDQYAEDFRVRLIQVATPVAAWVIDVETLGGWYKDCAVDYFTSFPLQLVFHNVSFDIQSLYPQNRAIQAEVWDRSTDTRILAHLADPTGKEEGGTGHDLDSLVKRYLPEFHKESDELKAEFLRLKKLPRTIQPEPLPEDWEATMTVRQGQALARKLEREWRRDTVIPRSAVLDDRFRLMPIDNEVFLSYAGMDAMLTARLYVKLKALVGGSALIAPEHRLAKVVSQADAKGILLDHAYAVNLSETLAGTETACKQQAAALGVENVNSVQQLALWLSERHVEVPVTEKGNPSIDGDFLDYLKNSEEYYSEVATLAEAVKEGKKAGKWRTTWVEKFLHSSDVAGRVHPSTNTLRARTARFSITGIPAQTLPSTDSMIRGCFIADPGERIVAVDYSNQELRYVAAVSRDAVMIQAFKEGQDLHLMTAEAAFPGRGKEMRPYGKTTNLSILYGIGLDKLQKELGLPMEDTRRLKNAFWGSYKGVKAFRDDLSKMAEAQGYIITKTGRKLPVDPDRGYTALNYYVQSGCRDVTARGLLRLEEAGYQDNIRLVIHDENLFSFPVDWFQGDVPSPRLEADIRKAMEIYIEGVHLPVEIKVGENSWGSLYASADTSRV